MRAGRDETATAKACENRLYPPSTRLKNISLNTLGGRSISFKLIDMVEFPAALQVR
jgi:hypothetical protein